MLKIFLLECNVKRINLMSITGHSRNLIRLKGNLGHEKKV